MHICTYTLGSRTSKHWIFIISNGFVLFFLKKLIRMSSNRNISMYYRVSHIYYLVSWFNLYQLIGPGMWDWMYILWTFPWVHPFSIYVNIYARFFEINHQFLKRVKKLNFGSQKRFFWFNLILPLVSDAVSDVQSSRSSLPPTSGSQTSSISWSSSTTGMICDVCAS